MRHFESLEPRALLAGSVTSLTLLNASNDKAIGPLLNGAVLNLKALGTTQLNVRANTQGSIGSVRFGLDSNSKFRTENSAPRSLAGDSGGTNYASWTPSIGTHTITATAFSSKDGAGSSSTPVKVTFKVVSNSTTLANPGNLVFSTDSGKSPSSKSFSVKLSNGSTGKEFSVSDDASWISTSPSNGSTNGTVKVSVSSSTLPIGVHTAFVTVASQTHGQVRVPVTLFVKDRVDQVHLAWVSDPSKTLTAVWHTNGTSIASQLQYRKAGASIWTTLNGKQRSFGSSGKLHEAALTGLSSDTQYEYRMLGEGNAWSNPYSARTAPSPGAKDFDAIFFADTSLVGRADGLDNGTRQMISDMAKLKPDLVLGGGDYAYFDTDKRYGTLEKSIDAWFNQIQPLASIAPLMPTYGNHETLLGEGFDPWAKRFATPNGFDSRRFYSFDVGNVHFMSILAIRESQAIPDDAINWIKNDGQAALAAGKTILPYMHVASFSDGTSHPSNLAYRAQLQPLFESLKVKIVLTAHDQTYERTFPLKGSNFSKTSSSLTRYDADDGITWVKVGPAGKWTNKGGFFSQFRTNPAPSYTAKRENDMHHFARLLVSAAGKIKVEIWGSAGNGFTSKVVDSFEYDLGASSRKPAVGAASFSVRSLFSNKDVGAGMTDVI